MSEVEKAVKLEAKKKKRIARNFQLVNVDFPWLSAVRSAWNYDFLDIAVKDVGVSYGKEFRRFLLNTNLNEKSEIWIHYRSVDGAHSKTIKAEIFPGFQVPFVERIYKSIKRNMFGITGAFSSCLVDSIVFVRKSRDFGRPDLFCIYKNGRTPEFISVLIYTLVGENPNT